MIKFISRPKTLAPMLLFVALLCMGVYFLEPFGVAREVIAPATQSGSTWSVVAVDAETGDVGVAAASCVPIRIEGLAALVPGKGAAATQAWFSLENRNQVFALLQEGQSAEAIIAAVTDPSYDEDAGQRQYGVLTIHDGTVEAAGFTGDKNEAWAGDLQELSAAVSVQGNILEGEAVVTDALAAFKDDTIGPVALPDRLMRALEAGSAAGGDKRCNEGDIQQTAQAAFILVAQGDQSPFAVKEIGLDGSSDSNAPWLYQAVLEPELGQNPLIALRQQYDQWRQENLPACPECDLQAIPVPKGGDSNNSEAAQLEEEHRTSSVAFMVVLTGLIGLIVVAVVMAKRRERENESSA
ncbi:MAG: DUF1028 domain-containing protein [Ardenticatenaceae bacterium]